MTSAVPDYLAEAAAFRARRQAIRLVDRGVARLEKRCFSAPERWAMQISFGTSSKRSRPICGLFR